MFIFLDANDSRNIWGNAFQQAAIYKFQRTSDFQKGTKFKPCDFEFFSIWRGDFNFIPYVLSIRIRRF